MAPDFIGSSVGNEDRRGLRHPAWHILLIGDQYGKTVAMTNGMLAVSRSCAESQIVGKRYTQQRTQDDILQAYLDKIGDLLLRKEKPLRTSEEDNEVRLLARARTLTTLHALGPERQSMDSSPIHRRLIPWDGKRDLIPGSES